MSTVNKMSLSFWMVKIIVLLIGFHKARTFDGCICVAELTHDHELHLPVSFVHANDGSNRIFVGELRGVVHIFYPNGTKIKEPFLDVSSTTGYVGKVAETGLTSMAFHPDFKSNGLIYMLVSSQTKHTLVAHYNNLFEFKVSATDENKADENYSRLLLKYGQPVSSHNADQLLFGIDKYLYVFIGDGGLQEDPKMWSQNMDMFYGKILRIDVDSRTGNLPYGIPQDNPFNDGSYPKPEMYALGLRNPWRSGMDLGDRETGEGRGRIIIGDVGQKDVEELDLLEKGANYGWNIFEGTKPYCTKSTCLKGPGNFTSPIFEYNRSKKMGKSVIGGQFYRGCRSPKLNGVYFWGDHDSGLLYRLIEDKDTGTWQNKEVEMCETTVCKGPLQSSYVGGIVSFGLDEEGEAYILTSEGRNPYLQNGHVYRIVEPSLHGDPKPCRVGITQTTVDLKQGETNFGRNKSSTPTNERQESAPATRNTGQNSAVEKSEIATDLTDNNDGSYESRENQILSAFKIEKHHLKVKLAELFQKLLNRFSSQDEDSVPQA